MYDYDDVTQTRVCFSSHLDFVILLYYYSGTSEGSPSYKMRFSVVVVVVVVRSKNDESMRRI